MKKSLLRASTTQNTTVISKDDRLFLELLGVGSEENCRYLWERRKVEGTPTPINKWLSLGNPRKGQGKLKNQFDIENLLSEKNNENETVDYFISPNEFFSWRCKKGLSKLHANYIDIDTTSHQIKSEEEQQTILDEVVSRIILTGIPKPNAIIKSGSGGLHLYWIYEPVEAYNYRMAFWKQFTNAIIERLSGSESWKVDCHASTDASRVLRLPGSKHNTSKRTVETIITNSELYKMEELYKELEIEVKRPSHLKLAASNRLAIPDSEKRKITPERLKLYQIRGRHNIKNWWKRIYDHTRMFCKNNGVKEGSRDYAAFILFVAKYNETDDEQKAFDTILEDNDTFIHLPKEELSKYLSTARTTQYKYKKDTIDRYLRENLNMPTDFLFETSNKASLTPIEVKKRQKLSALSTAKKKRSNKLAEIQAAIKDIATNRVRITAQTIAQYSNIPIRTVYRYWSQVQIDTSVIRCASI